MIITKEFTKALCFMVLAASVLFPTYALFAQEEGSEGGQGNQEPAPSSSPAPSTPSGGGGGTIVDLLGKVNDGYSLTFPWAPSASIASAVVQPTTTEPAPQICVPLIKTKLKLGGPNDAAEVQKLELFLNEHMQSGLTVDSLFDLATENAVKAFQLKHKETVLKPWVEAGLWDNVDTPTGVVYITTRHMIDVIRCPWVAFPAPAVPTRIQDL